MKKDIFEGLKYTVINSLIIEFQGSNDIEYRNELINVINMLNIFLNYDNFLENCKSTEQININNEYILRIRNIAVSSLYNAQIEDIEKDIIIVELSKFFNRCIDIKELTKDKNNIKIKM